MRVLGKHLFVLVILLGSIFISCKKEDGPVSETEHIENELRAVVEDNNIERVVPIKGPDSFTNSISASAGDKFDFSNGFLKVNGFAYDSYNLELLKNYKVALVTVVYSSRSRSEKALLVYFD